ncbi:MAG: hypothetical protein WCT05_01625 [Lentisphaeria bacterium]
MQTEKFTFDWRKRQNGRLIAKADYIDQPYLLKTDETVLGCVA